MSLIGKTALITGSTSGIGRGIAEKLGMAGCNLVISGLGEPKDIEAEVSDFCHKCGTEVMFVGADLSKVNEIEKMMQDIKEKTGGVDILVNNAGIQHVSPIEEFPTEKWDAVMAVDLSAAFHTTRLAVPIMRERKWGRIINIASAHALVASPFKSAYVAAKHGILGLSKVVAMEVAQDNITCNAICPGYVKTPLVEGQIASTAKARGISEQEVVQDVMLGEQPTKKFVEISEVADYVAFLCSDGAQSITGAALSIDGGWTSH